jgi:translation initiation factor 2 gamma subunit (eIF-2gamma)
MKIGTIGHVNHGKTTLTCAIESALEKERSLTIDESIEQDNAMMITALKEYGGIEELVKSGRENRRERRKRERKNK